jgi:hypothetical protein
MVHAVQHELVFSVRLAEGDTLSGEESAAEGFAISSLPDRDPAITAFLVSFAASATLQVLLALRRIAGARALTLAMKHKGRRLTINTDDEGLDIELLSRVMKDFYRED